MIDRVLGGLVVRRPLAVGLALALATAAAAVALTRFRIEADLSTQFPHDAASVALLRHAATADSSPRNLVFVLRGHDVAGDWAAFVEALRRSPHLEVVDATREELLGADLAAVRAAPLPWLPPDVLDALAHRLTGGRGDAVARLEQTITEDPLLGLAVARRDPLGVRWIFDEAVAARVPDALDPAAPGLVLADGSAAFVRARARREAFDMDFTHALLDDLEQRLAPWDTDIIGAHPIAAGDEARLRGDLQTSALASVTLVSLFLLIALRSLHAPALIVTPVVVGLVWTFGLAGPLLGPVSPLSAASAAVLAGLGADFGIHYLGRYREERAHRGHDEAVLATCRHLGRPLAFGMLTTVGAFLSLGVSTFRGLWTLGVLLVLGLALTFVATYTGLPLLLRVGRHRPPPTPRRSPVVEAAHRLVESRLGRPALAAVLAAAAAGWTLVAVHGLTFDADLRRLRPAGDPMLALAAEMEAALGFSPLPLTVLVDRAVDLETCRAAAARLEADETIGLVTGPHRRVPPPEGLAAARAFRQRTAGWVDGALADLAAAGFDAPALEPTLRELQATLEAEPPAAGDGPVVTWKGRDHRVLQVYPARTPWLPEARAEIRAALDAAWPTPPLVVSAFGLSDVLTPILRRDLMKSTAVSAAIVVVLMLALYGLAHGALAMLPMLTGTGALLGALAVLDLPLHLGNFVALPLIIGIGIDDGIHMVARHREWMRRRRRDAAGPAGGGASPGSGPRSPRGAARAGGAAGTSPGTGTSSPRAADRAEPPPDVTYDGHAEDLLHTTGASIWRTSATTMLAFGSLVFATSPGLASLGGLLLVGVASCLVASLLVLPVLLRASGGAAAGLR